MISSFIPVVLLVLTGFALGLIVGRMAWKATSTPDGPHPTPEESPAADEGASTAALNEAMEAADGEADDPPRWLMKQLATGEIKKLPPYVEPSSMLQPDAKSAAAEYRAMGN